MRKTLTRLGVVAGAVALVSVAGAGAANAAEPGCLTKSTVKAITDPVGDITMTLADPGKDIADTVSCVALPFVG